MEGFPVLTLHPILQEKIIRKVFYLLYYVFICKHSRPSGEATFICSKHVEL